MKAIRPAVVALSALAAACGGDGKNTPPDGSVVVPDAPPPDSPPPPPPPDAPNFDFSCMNNPAPTTAADPITVSGEANGLDLNGAQPQVVPLTDATIDACVAECAGGDKLDTQTTASNCPSTGCPFTTDPLATGGTPLDGYIKVSKATYRTSNIFPPAPLTANTAGVPALAFSNAAFQGILLFLNIDHDPGNANLGIVVTDCANTPIGGAQITVKQNGADVPNITVLDAGSLGAMGEGTYLVFNVPPGATEVGASFNGMQLRAHTVAAFADETTATQLRPGF